MIAPFVTGEADKTRARLTRMRQRIGQSHSKAWNEANPEKRAAQKAVEKAIRTGTMQRQPCERCGSVPAQAHHDDYSQPLAVMWLCPRHHKQRHRELAEAEQ